MVHALRHLWLNRVNICRVRMYIHRCDKTAINPLHNRDIKKRMSQCRKIGTQSSRNHPLRCADMTLIAISHGYEM